MLKTIGRGLAPAANCPLPPAKKLTLIQKLPDFVNFNRNSDATIRNSHGKLVEVAPNQPRFDHTMNGSPLGLFIEPEATNKCENFNVNPINIDGFNSAGSGTIEVVDDSEALTAAGLEEICTSGKVFKAQATSSSTFVVYVPGTVGNLNPHSVSIYARGEGAGIRTARLSIGGSMLNITPASEGYQRYVYENLIPSNTGRKLTLSIDGNEAVYFILYQLEEGPYATSVIPVKGDSVTRPADRAFINEIDQQDWFDPAQGYMICRYAQQRLLETDAYAAVLNDGTSANTIGLRLDQTNHNLRSYIRANSTSQFILANQDYQIAGTLNAAGIKWNAGTAELLSGGQINNETLTQLPTGIHTLEIGARNGGASPMHGHIRSIEIGTQDLSLKQLGNKLQTSEDLMIIGGGQSLMRGHFKSQESDGEEGKQKHREIIGQTLGDQSIIMIDGSLGGSAACKTSNGSLYWWDLATGSRGPAFDNFYTQIEDVGAKPTHVLWAQGEEDSHYIGEDTSATDYKQALEAIFSNMRANLGDIKIYIQSIGRRGSFANVGGVQAVRDIQQEIINENDWCYAAAETYDLALYDQVHLTDAAYVIAAQRNSIALLGAAGATGPQINTVLRSGTSLTVTIIHDAGTDFVPASGIEGFKFFDDTNEILILSAERTNDTALTLILAETPSSGIETLYYGYDDMSGLNPANVLRDNAATPMPLRPAKILL